jgi:hypothetical protein
MAVVWRPGPPPDIQAEINNDQRDSINDRELQKDVKEVIVGTKETEIEIKGKTQHRETNEDEHEHEVTNRRNNEDTIKRIVTDTNSVDLVTFISKLKNGYPLFALDGKLRKLELVKLDREGSLYYSHQGHFLKRKKIRRPVREFICASTESKSVFVLHFSGKEKLRFSLPDGATVGPVVAAFSALITKAREDPTFLIDCDTGAQPLTPSKITD